MPMPDVTVAGTSPCLLCPDEQHPFFYDRAGSYIIQCPKLAAERDTEELAQLLPTGAGFWLALTRSGRLYRMVIVSESRATLTPMVLAWTQQARPVG